ncbi:hypothetical protein [Paracoccus methylarcula]|uniref:hypothetical protein n=1 Tax=Paracoccus methylarcula TaxID=72022 RepID=UPI0026816FF6
MLKRLTTTAALALATAAPAMAENWTMTTTWPSSLELIEIDKHWVELVDQLVDDDKLTIEFYDGGSLVPAGEVFGAVESGTVQAGGDWPGYWAGRDSAFSPLSTTASLFNAVDYVNWIQEWGGADLYNEVYGKFGMVYLPYGVTNNESGFRTVDKPVKTIEDLNGLRLRLSGLEQGKLLEKLGGNQVSMAGGEIYQSLERGVIDGAEFSTPNVDFSGGFQQVTKYWSTPGWHQSSSVFGVMINKGAWDALDEDTQNKLKIAAEATCCGASPSPRNARPRPLPSSRKPGPRSTGWMMPRLSRSRRWRMKPSKRSPARTRSRPRSMPARSPICRITRPGATHRRRSISAARHKAPIWPNSRNVRSNSRKSQRQVTGGERFLRPLH